MIKKIYKISEIQEKLTPIFEANNVQKAILFGSYAKGKATSVSDVDILIDDSIRGLDFFGVLEDITQTLKKKIELISMYDIQPSTRIYNEIHDTGVILYDRQRYKAAQ